MRIPRSVSGSVLIKKLRQHEYEVTRQTGSHIRLATSKNGTHHVTIPNHDPLRIGTFSAIVSSVADHLSMSKKELMEELFG